VQFVLCETNAGGSSTKSLISRLKSKHGINVILESEDHKTIPRTGRDPVTNYEKGNKYF